MADGFVGLQFALTNGFGNYVRRLMCYYHAKTSMERKMTSLQMLKAHRCELIEGVRMMQRSETEAEFFALAQLFLVKWRAFEVDKVK